MSAAPLAAAGSNADLLWAAAAGFVAGLLGAALLLLLQGWLQQRHRRHGAQPRPQADPDSRRGELARIERSMDQSMRDMSQRIARLEDLVRRSARASSQDGAATRRAAELAAAPRPAAPSAAPPPAAAQPIGPDPFDQKVAALTVRYTELIGGLRSREKFDEFFDALRDQRAFEAGADGETLRESDEDALLIGGLVDERYVIFPSFDFVSHFATSFNAERAMPAELKATFSFRTDDSNALKVEEPAIARRMPDGAYEVRRKGVMGGLRS